MSISRTYRQRSGKRVIRLRSLLGNQYFGRVNGSQEPLAPDPALVKFFSRERDYLGNKRTLERIEKGPLIFK